MQTVSVNDVVVRTRPRASAGLTRRERRSLALQGFLGRIAFIAIGPAAVLLIRLVQRNRIEGLQAARRVYQQAVASGRPTIVCANHLTMFDSAFLLHAFGSVFEYMANFRLFSWNVPAVENFTRSPFWRTVVYLGKCIPIDRAGDPAHHRSVLDRLAYLVTHREVCMIFPEGGRSRTGRVEVDHVAYGVGHILSALDRPQVVCAYLRGEKQATYSDTPARGDVLHVRAEVIEPTTDQTGMRGAKDLAQQVIVKLRDMEDRFFEAFPAPAGDRMPG